MNSKCKRCSLEIVTDEYVQCSNGDCQGKFHFDCSIPEEAYRKLTSSKKKIWRCNMCNKTKSTRSVSTTQQDEENEDKTLKAEMKDIKKMLNTILSKVSDIDSIKTDMEELKKNGNFISEQYDAIQNQLLENNQLVNNMGQSIDKLEKENEETDKTIRDLNFKLNKLEQYSRNRNIEIGGYPQEPNEDCTEIILNIAKQIKVNLRQDDIETAHRIPTKNKNIPPPIIAQFQSKKKKRRVLIKEEYNYTQRYAKREENIHK